MNRRGFFGALASVCGAAAGAAVLIALPAPKPSIYSINPKSRVVWRCYAGKCKPVTHAEMVAMMEQQFWHTKAGLESRPFGIDYWLTKR
jgi:hypothetical protein